MPTGYTADIKDGISFKTFVMNCARAFGACITLRDEPGGGDMIPETFEPSDYHLKALEKARAALADLEAMTPEQCARAAAKAWDDEETSRQQRLAERARTKAAYKAMLTQVRGWTPPTDEHQGLKDFMVEQITSSIDFDCGPLGSWDEPKPMLGGEEWREKARAKCAWDIDYHTKEHADEVARSAGRTAWVSALRDSLQRL